MLAKSQRKLENAYKISFKNDIVIIGHLKFDNLLAALFRSVNESAELIIEASGTYLLPDPVPIDGRVVGIRIFGLFNEENTARYFGPQSTRDNLAIPYVCLLVLRQSLDTKSYKLISEPYPLNHTFMPGMLRSNELNWIVQEGDRIGAIIPQNCSEYENQTYCPSHINLRAGPDECLSALYYDGNASEDLQEGNHTIPVERFQRVQVRLNLEVEIEPSGSHLPIIIVAALLGLLCILCAICVVVLVVCCVRSQRKPKLDFPSKQEVQVVEVGKDDKGEQQPMKNNLEFINHLYDEILPIRSPEIVDGYTLLGQEERIGTKVTVNERYEIDGYDYLEAYFEPASKEEDLLQQLSTKLSLPMVPQEDLQLCEVLGSGAFGTVYRGVWSHHETDSQVVKEEVAVKTIDQGVDETEKVKFLQEATIMAQFKHSNIVRIRGIAIEKKALMLILDLLRGGDLRHYLLTSVRNHLELLDPLELGSTLLSYTRQVALGMMSLMQKSYVHRDLAARNILVSEDGMTCKIADFGLSRDLHEENFYISHGGKIPVKWTAPEALQYRCYSSASDVWSYGCVLYEIWSLGEKPFHDMTNPEAMKYIATGSRLAPPPGCPKAIYNIMMKCWHPTAEKRLCFSDITQQLQQSDFHILKWSADDVNLYSKEARTIGTALHLGKALFKELQDTYTQSCN